MVCNQHNHEEDHDNQQDYDRNPGPSIPSDSKVIKLKGKLMKLLVTDAIQPRLYFSLRKTQLLEPFTDHLHLENLPDLFQVGIPVRLRHRNQFRWGKSCVNLRCDPD